jgi:uncharacterized membrane protein YtjA (UPF0391 family)
LIGARWIFGGACGLAEDPGAGMLRWALIFLAVALATAMLGFTSVAGPAVVIARILFYVFAVLFLISVFMPLFRSRPSS